MCKIDVPAGYVISSYGSDSNVKFSVLFAPPESIGPRSDSTTIELSMEPETLNALPQYQTDEE